VATTSLTRSQQAARSTVSGLIMIGYLLAHMYGNLKVFAGQAAFDDYAHHLRTLGEPLLPYSGALWVIRVVLLAAIIAHVYSAASLWKRDRRARGGTSRYASSKARRGVQRSYASFTLRWGGIVIILFVIYHLLHLTWNVVAPGGASDSPYARLVNGFTIWWLVLAYTIALLAVGFHLRHGVWSALTTLGANTSAVTRRRLNILAYVVTIVITGGFLLVPFAILFGVVS
jgi:succinate dehydrogenase / fumarate reductase cytochrome b subunit